MRQVGDGCSACSPGSGDDGDPASSTRGPSGDSGAGEQCPTQGKRKVLRWPAR
jgi:hypothetical protein